MNHSLLLVTLLLSAAIPAGLAAESTAAKTEAKSGSAHAQYEALVKEYEAARDKFYKAYEKASEEERQKLNYPEPDTFSDRFLALAREVPDDDAALDALVWVATNCRASNDQDPALALLLRDHAKSSKLGEVALALVYSDSAQAEQFLRALLKDSPHHEVKGNAAYSLGYYLNRKDRNPKEAEALFEDVAAHYSDVKAYRGTLADLAQGQLFELRHLQIGQIAPEIVGKNVEGKELKLSTYRGKVVTIDFWGDW